ncbi:hypothetical protein D3C78_1611450 [compost metagenome]
MRFAGMARSYKGAVRRISVGWVERSDTQKFLGTMLGIAVLNTNGYPCSSRASPTN